MNVAIWGAGNLGEALVAGFVDHGLEASRIFVSNKERDDRLSHMEKRYGVKTGRSLAGLDPDVLVLVTKPFNVEEVAASLRRDLRPDTLVVSCLAGVKVRQLHEHLGGHAQVMRAMPNLNAEVGQSFTALYAEDTMPLDLFQVAFELFARVGEVERTDEASLDHLTVLSGSGPAMIATFWRVLLSASAEIGIEPATAEKALRALFSGTPQRLDARGLTPQEFVDQVTTRGGVTEAMMAVLSEQGLASMIGQAFRNASQRNDKIGGPPVIEATP